MKLNMDRESETGVFVVCYVLRDNVIFCSRNLLTLADLFLTSFMFVRNFSL